MLRVEGVSKAYSGKAALATTTLEFGANKTTVLIGPSGCGKSTLLRILIGLVTPDIGTVKIDGENLSPANLQSIRHRMGYVIQDGGLFPHLTAYDNVVLLGRYLRRTETQLQARVCELADLTKIRTDLLDKFPHTLSGGERQRFALMRAALLDPPILLLDEPLGSLDPMTRAGMQAELKEIFSRLNKTVVLVTHDMHEAAFFADDIALMRDGRIVQHGPLTTLLHQPADAFVTEFIRAQRTRIPDVV